MRLPVPTRFKVRTLMIAIAGVALAFGTAFEWWNHRPRNYYLRSMLWGCERAFWHYQQWVVCKNSDGRVPYPRSQRTRVIDEFYGPGRSPGTFYYDGWSAEANWHLYWATRLSDQAQFHIQQLRAYQRRLLFP
jgi:hypothetical protein